MCLLDTVWEKTIYDFANLNYPMNPGSFEFRTKWSASTVVSPGKEMERPEDSVGAYYDRRGKSTVESELDGTQVHYSEDSICDGTRPIILQYWYFWNSCY